MPPSFSFVCILITHLRKLKSHTVTDIYFWSRLPNVAENNLPEKLSTFPNKYVRAESLLDHPLDEYLTPYGQNATRTCPCF